VAQSVLNSFWNKQKEQHDLNDHNGLLEAVESLPALHILHPNDAKQINKTFNLYALEAKDSEMNIGIVTGIILEFQKNYLTDVQQNAHMLNIDGLTACLDVMRIFKKFLRELQEQYSDAAQTLLGEFANKMEHAAPHHLSVCADIINFMSQKVSACWMPNETFFEKFFDKGCEFMESRNPGFNTTHYMNIIQMPANLYTAPTKQFKEIAEEWGLENTGGFDETHIINITGAIKNYECFTGIKFEKLTKQFEFQLNNIANKPSTGAQYKERALAILAIP